MNKDDLSYDKRLSFFKDFLYYLMEVLASPQDYADAFDVLVDRLSATHKYLELMVSLQAFYDLSGDDPGRCIDVLPAIAAEAERDGKLKTNLIINLDRFPDLDFVWGELELAKRCFDEHDNVVGITLAGDEASYPTDPFVPVIKAAKEHGMWATIHAGEWGSAREVWSALEAGADRIGHGIRSADDPLLMEELVKRGVTLEVCPTSNLSTGASKDLSEMRSLAEAGVILSVNTDDPAVFGDITLENEYRLFLETVPGYEIKQPLLFNRRGEEDPQEQVGFQPGSYSELHLHLEGAVFPEALERIRKRRAIRSFQEWRSSTFG